MKRRTFVRLLSSGSTLGVLAGCGFLRVDPMHFLIRSDRITSTDQEAEVLGRAKVERTEDGRVQVLFTRGTHYECGYQHGALLREDVQDNLGYLYEQSVKIFRSRELFAEAYERLRPFVPQEYIDEMHGLAHGAKLPLEVIHHVHALPSITEWGGKQRLKAIVKKMIAGELGTSCSNIGVQSKASADGNLYAVRVLDWGLHRISKLHRYPLISVSRPSGKVPFANIGWVGFVGSVSGMNAEGITLGEMGYKDPPNETLRGKAMPFLLREILENARSLSDARSIISKSPGTNSFGYLITDGKSGEAELYVRDPDRFEVKQPGVEVVDRDMSIPAIADISYGGHDEDQMAEVLMEYRGSITPEVLMSKIIPSIAMKSNFQNVVYDPARLRFWVNNAGSSKLRAAEQPYTFFDLRKALKE